MSEITYNTAFSFRNRDLLLEGYDNLMLASFSSLIRASRNDVIDMFLSDLKDENDVYQVVLTIKKLDANG